MKYQTCVLFVAALTAAACSDSKTPIESTPDAGHDSTNTQSSRSNSSTRSNTSSHGGGSTKDTTSNTTRDTDVEGPDAESPFEDWDSSTPANANVQPTSETNGQTTSNVDEPNAPDADTSQLDASSTTRLDAGNPNDPTYRFCSNDALDTVTWKCDEQGQDCTTPVNQGKCPLPWGCDDYSAAVQAAADRCPDFVLSLITYSACGFSVIERRVGAGDPLRGFYNSSGELLGSWSTTDTFEPERCSGYVPEACVDWEVENLVDKQDLCAQDAGNADADD